MQAFINYQGMPFPVPAGNLMRIGSSPECEIRLPDDPYLSRRHCSVSLVDGELTIVDLRSSHGTLVNDVLLQEAPRVLKDGDHIKLGETEITVSIRPDA